MYKKILSICVFTLLGQIASADEVGFVHLGVMSHDCGKLNKSSNEPSVKFKLSAVEAAVTVKATSRYGCYIKMGFGVYSDNQNYYFVNNNLLFNKPKSIENIKKYSFIVQANTGKLISKPEYER